MDRLQRCRGMRIYPRSDERISGKIPMAMTNPLQFLQQTRSEVSKVVWPSRREVLVTTLMVFALAVVGAAFFSLVDILIRMGLEQILSLGA